MTGFQLGGYDPLDARLDDGAAAARAEGRGSFRLGLAGWSASSVPVATLLLVGIGLGPQGLSLLSPGVLARLDPAVPVALAGMGVLVGLNVDLRRRADRRPMAAAWLESVVVAVLVSVGLAVLAPSALTATGLPHWMAAGAIGLCAASSLAVPGGYGGGERAVHLRVAELGVLPPIVVSGLLLGVMHAGATAAALGFVLQAAAIALLFGVSGWLLLAGTASDAEQRVFAFASILLIGGAADFLALSALLSGLVSGMFWEIAGGPARESIRRDALYVQHSLIVLVLVVAGARAEISLAAAGVAAACVFLRTAATLLAGSWAGRVAGSNQPRTLGRALLVPGVFGVALALTVARAAGPTSGILLAIVVLWTIGSEIVSGLARPGPTARSAAEPPAVPS
jgi:hypothetical protein